MRMWGRMAGLLAGLRGRDASRAWDGAARQLLMRNSMIVLWSAYLGAL